MQNVTLNKEFGKYAGTCDLCYQDKKEFGVLIDNNGHMWRICIDDIRWLWAENQASITEQRIEDRAQEIVTDTIATMVRNTRNEG